MRNPADLIDDPRAVTLAVTSLLAGALWVATWSTMGQMDMGAMGMPMDGMAGGDMGSAADTMGGADWSLMTIWSTFVMWVLMMAAMMLPAMAPVMAVYAGLAAREQRGLRLAARIGLFTAGYFLLWGAVSLALAVLQLALRDSVYFSMGGTLASAPVAAGLLIAAGVYQFTPLKAACLQHCRHPLTFLLSHWREGIAGAFPIGLHHGAYCVGCCILFMGLMFVFGAMNVWWMAVIAAYFLAEKIAPKAESWSRLTGAALIVVGLGLAAQQTFA
ncbi:MAG: DUF2182 domain-containing protein [Pseudomonadota bacterium]